MPSCATQQLLDWLVVGPTRPQPDPSLVSPAEWDELIAAAVAHTTAPQLFHRLSTESRTVPPQALQCAFLAMVWQRQQNSHLEPDLSAVLRVLNSEGITPILLKGAHLATMIYPDPSYRPMSDLDLLVRLDQMETSEKALQSIGYTLEHWKSIAHWNASSKEVVMSKEGSLPIDLHWTIANPQDPVSIDIDSLRQRAKEITVFGQAARVLAVEDLLLHICYHAGVTHQFDEKGLRPLLDVRAITERFGGSLDWNVLDTRAREWGSLRCTYLLLELARQLGAVSIPEDVLVKLKPAKVSHAVYEAARAQMFELPGRLQVRPRSIAWAWIKPHFTRQQLFAPQAMQHATIRGHMLMYVTRYIGYAWHFLCRDRKRLVVFIKQIRHHLVLGAWLARERSGRKP